MKEIPDKSIDLVLTDPPYGTTHLKWDKVIDLDLMWTQLKRVIKPRGAIILCAGQPFTSALIMSNVKMFKYELIWDRIRKSSPGTAKFRPMPSHENVLVFGFGKITYNPQMLKGRAYKANRDAPHNLESGQGLGYGFKKRTSISNTGTRYPGSICLFKRDQGRDSAGTFLPSMHPTQKPVALMEYMIRTYTNQGETVLDFTCGSGTTGVAARRLARYFIGIELDPGYFEIAKKRIEDA